MTGFVKLFQSILGSSIWAEDDKTLRVWIALLVLKDRHHVVKMAVSGLAHVARVSAEECRNAIEKFKSPDDDSSDKQHEGRKIEELPEGGWKILNGERYAKMLSLDERREYNRIKQAELRARIKAGKKKPRARSMTPGPNGREQRADKQYRDGDMEAFDATCAEGIPDHDTPP